VAVMNLYDFLKDRTGRDLKRPLTERQNTDTLHISPLLDGDEYTTSAQYRQNHRRIEIDRSRESRCPRTLEDGPRIAKLQGRRVALLE